MLIKSLFKVGDVVRVRKEYHPGYNGRDYPHHFTSEMLDKFGGGTFRITEVIPLMDSQGCKEYYALYKEPYKYVLNNIHYYIWSAAMFDNFDDLPTIF